MLHVAIRYTCVYITVLVAMVIGTCIVLAQGHHASCQEEQRKGEITAGLRPLPLLLQVKCMAMLTHTHSYTPTHIIKLISTHISL